MSDNPQKKQEEKPYRYFDTPDGEDTLKKLWCVMKPTIPTAAFIALIDIMCVSQPKGLPATAFRFARVSLPYIGIASTFVVATNSIANLRQKDDRLNWFLGGFIAGTGVGVWHRNPMWGFNMGMLGGIIGFMRKEAAIQGWEVTPKTQMLRGGATSMMYDFSLTADKPKNWTTGKS